MEILGHETNNKYDKMKKIIKISLIISVILFFIVLGLMIYYNQMESQKLKLYVDKQKRNLSTTLLQFDKENSKIYVSLQELSKMIGYEYFIGTQLSEEQNKCYLKNNNELAGFELGSKQIYKTDPNENTRDYNWYTVDAPVRTINGKLYATSSAIQTALDLKFNYNEELNRIEIYTLPYLVSIYEGVVTTKYEYSGLDSEYNSQKAILKDMLVVKKQENKDKIKYGVITLDGKQIIGPKYDKIEYIEIANDFYVTSSGKVGIMSNDGGQKIAPNYDTIKVLDNDLRLYYVQNGTQCGVLDRNGKRIVYIEYNKIGVDSSLFPSNDIKNSMLLFDNCIPVMRNNKWGLFDKNGNILVDTVYDSLGYVNGTSKDVYDNNLIIIPSIQAIVICKDNKYGLISSTGKFLAPLEFDKIYSITNMGQDTYYMEYRGQTFTVEEYLKVNGQTVKEVETIQSIENQEQNTTEQTNQTTDSDVIIDDTQLNTVQ